MTKVSTQIFLIKKTQGTIMSAVKRFELLYSLALAPTTNMDLCFLYVGN